METLNYIKNLDFFKKLNSNFEISKSTEDIYVVSIDGIKKYTVRVFSKDSYKSIVDKKHKIDTLIEKGRKLYPILEVGIINELALTYRITDYINGIKRYDNDKDNYKLGYYIGETIRDYHELSKPIKNDNWVKNYGHKIRNIFHEYYLCDYIGKKDYILFDYVKQFSYLIKDREAIEIFSFNNIRDIPVDRKGKVYLFGVQGIVEADPFFEFKDININYYKDEAYSAGIIDGYFSGRPNRLFFKTIALYTITETFGTEFKKFDKVNCEVAKLKVQELSEYYDDFNTVYPNWYLEIKEKLNGGN